MARGLDRLFTVEDWASFEGDPAIRYELFDGRLVAMAPAKTWHGAIANQIGLICAQALAGRFPCRALQQAGVTVRREAPADGYIPDVVVTCEPIDDNRALVEEPRLVVEILSQSTDCYDKTVKLPSYMGLPSVEEIWFAWSTSRAVLVWRRDVDGSWPEKPDASIGRGSFRSAVLSAVVELEEIYRFVPMRAPEPIELPGSPEAP